MTVIGERTLAFRIDEELHREIKLKLAAEGKTLKGYVLSLIREDLKNGTADIDITKAQKAALKLQIDSENLVKILKAEK